MSLGKGTAQEVSETVDVPRTRVYDAVAELQDHGLVDVQQSSPKRFWAISTETVGRHFEREYTHRVNALTDALDDIEPTERSLEQRGVWTVTGRDTVTDRVIDFVEAADDEVVYMTVESLLTEDVTDALSAASERGVSIRLAEMSQSTEETIRAMLPDAELFESIWDWADTPAGRLMMVDEERTLVSVLAPGDGEHPPESLDETAIWGSGETNGLVVVLKAMFTWQLDGNRG